METLQQNVTERPVFTAVDELELERRSATLKVTYALLSVSLAGAAAGAAFGAQVPEIREFFGTLIGWVVALVLLNVVPHAAMAMVKRPRGGMAVLALDGVISGVVISPLVYLAAVINPALIILAAGVTAAVFLSVTAVVVSTRRKFSAPRAFVVGAFLSIAAGVVVNHYLDLGLLGILISAAIAIFGVLVLVSNTARVLREPVNTGAIPGALLLFAGIFNVFLGVLNIFVRLAGGHRR
jgi:modulator of FtsH protease